MTLKDQLEKWASDQQRLGRKQGQNSQSMVREHFGMTRMLNLLWPCIEALEYINTAPPGIQGNDEWVLQATECVSAAFVALTELKNKLEGGNG